jgi:membrane protein implicated in regulation of membrane protease activity
MFTELWAFAFAWYNLPFTFLLGLCFLLAAFQLNGLSADHDADVDGDADFDADADLDAEADADADTDADGDADHDVEHPAEGTSPLAVLAFVGVGKAPLLVVVVLLCGSIGLAGWGLNGLLGGLGLWANLLALPLAVMAGGLVSARLTRWIGRALPPITTSATRAQELVGRRGRVTSPFVDQRYGQVHLRTAGGTLVTIFAITDSPEPIRRGEAVVLAAYDRPARRYWVTPAPEGLSEPADE